MNDETVPHAKFGVRVLHSDNALSYMQLQGFARALFIHNLCTVFL